MRQKKIIHIPWQKSKKTSTCSTRKTKRKWIIKKLIKISLNNVRICFLLIYFLLCSSGFHNKSLIFYDNIAAYTNERKIWVLVTKFSVTVFVAVENLLPQQKKNKNCSPWLDMNKPHYRDSEDEKWKKKTLKLCQQFKVGFMFQLISTVKHAAILS